MKKVHWTQTPEGKRHFARRRAEREAAAEPPIPVIATDAPPAPATLEDFTQAVEVVARITGKTWREAVRTVIDLVEKS